MVRPPARNNFGDRSGAAATYQLDNVWLAPLSSSEQDVQGTDSTSEGFTAYVLADPAGLDVRPDDEADLDAGPNFKVSGPPRPWADRGIEFTLFRIRG